MKVLDCTIRDGGLMNKWQFEDSCVREVVSAAARSGVDYIEIGYKASTEFFDPQEYGKWRFSREEDLKEVWSETFSPAKLTIMLDIGRFRLEEMIPRSHSLVSAYRVACYAHQIPEAVEATQVLHDLGYETFINIMAVSDAEKAVLKKGLNLIGRLSPCRAVYVVDSFGSLSMDQTRKLVQLYKQLCPGKGVGFHGHNNQQLALANTLAAIEGGADFVDASLFGMGRGAGNCPLELLLVQIGRPGEVIKPLAAAIERHINPLRKKLRWGYHLPYALSGVGNSHPRKAMAAMADDSSVMTDEFWDNLALPS